MDLEKKNTEIDKEKDNENFYQIDPQKMKKVLEHMKELDENPDSEKTKEFLQKVEEFEKKHPPRQKLGKTIIRTVKKGRVLSEKFIEQEAPKTIEKTSDK